MKLYYTPGACSLASHIVAAEAGLPLALERVDLRAKTTASGADFTQISAKGYVPVLELDNGEVLTEGTAVMQYLADLKPESGLAPAAGSMARYRLLEMLGYINSEIHKPFGALFNPAITPEAREGAIKLLSKRYALVEDVLGRSPYLLGEQFTAADAYLYTVTNWSGFLKVDLSAFPNVLAHQQRVGARPAVQAAQQAERGA